MIKISNILLLNNWRTDKYGRIIVSMHLAMFGAIGLDLMGFEIPILRQVISFIYLTFIPGFIILRLLKVNELSSAETVIFSAGLSLSFIMFGGFFINLILSMLNFGQAFSFRVVFLFLTLIVIVLFVISSRAKISYQSELHPLLISRKALYLMLLPIISIAGTYFVNFQENNTILLVLMVLIALISVLVASDKIPSELYPLTIVVIAISLLFQYSLISANLIGYDVHSEYFYHKLVVENAFWNSKISSNANAMLSIVILPTVYSYFLNMDGVWIFKIVYPIIFSLVPLGLFCVYKRLFENDKIAFFSTFFFMSFFTFFTEMLSLARQEIAELFFVLLIFLMIQKTMENNVRNILLILFGASLVVSHYGLSYIYIILIIIVYVFSFINPIDFKLIRFQLPEFNLKKRTLRNFVAFYIVFSILWYTNVSSSSALNSIINVINHVFNSLFTEFYNVENRDTNIQLALGIARPVITSFGREIHKDLQILSQILILIGFVKIIISRNYLKLNAEFFYLIIASLFILFLSLLPYSAKSLNMTRIYHIALFAISPLFIIGGLFFINKINKIFNNNKKQNNLMLNLLLLIMIPYFLFNTGFVYEITKDIPISISMGKDRMKMINVSKENYYSVITPANDISSARWYYKYADKNTKLYSDGVSKLHVLNSYGMTPQYKTYNPFREDKIMDPDFIKKHYLYLSMFNVCENTFVDSNSAKFNTSIFSSVLNTSSKVYTNGCGDIYAK